MPVVPGTKVQVSFYTFTGSLPPLYYPANQGKLTVASVNAGNSDTLCVGLGGVNLGFLKKLGATQKRVNLSPQQSCAQGNYDDYQDRHVTLLKQADGGGSAFNSYSNPDPCAFSYVNPARLGASTGWEGVCFVDVFDPKLCPEGNPLNSAMLYAAPPFDGNYTTKAAFLNAIQALALNIIKAIAGYNAVAAQNKQPVIEALQNTLYSSGLYNRILKVSQDEIARAIFAGFTAELANHPNSGLVELQFPVGDPLATPPQDRLFAAIQDDLTAPHQVAMVPPHRRKHRPVVAQMGNVIVRGAVVEGEHPREDPYDDWGDRRRLDSFKKVFDPKKIEVKKSTLGQVSDDVRNATTTLIDYLTRTVKAGGQYNNLGLVNNSNYEGVHAPLGTYEGTDVVLGGITQAIGAVQTTTVKATPATNAALDVAFAAVNAQSALKGAKDARTFRDLKIERDVANNAAREARSKADLAGREARNSGASLDQAAATAAEEVAKRVEGLARMMDHGVKIIDSSRKAWYRNRIALIAGLTTLLLSLGGVATWLFAFGGARKQPDDQDLDIFTPIAPTGPNTVTVDIFLQNNLPADTGATVSLWVNGAKQTISGPWSVANNIVTYAPVSTPPANGFTDTIQYVVADNQSALSTDPKNLTITYFADIVIAASNLTTKISFAIPFAAADQFMLVNPGSAWMLTTDPTTQKTTVTFNPAGATGLLASVAYTLGGQSAETAQLVVLLPGPTLTGATNASRTDTSPPAQLPTIPASPGPGVWTLIPDPKNPPVTQQTSYAEMQGGATIGTWMLSGSMITFMPANLPNTVSQATVNFGLLLEGKVSAPGSWTVQFAPPGTVITPTQMDVTFIAPQLPDPTHASFPFTVPAMFTKFQLTTGGPWGMNGGQIVFTPPAQGFDPSIAYTTPYTAATFVGNVVVLFPQNIAVSNVERFSSSTPIDFTKKLPLITALKDPYTITVNPTMNPFGGTWNTVADIVQFVPATDLVLQTDSATTQYTLSFTDRPSVTASLTVNFTTALQAYAVTATVTATTPLPIKILNFIYFPNGPSSLQDIQLTDPATGNKSHTVTVNGATWNYDSTTNPPQITLDISGSTDNTFPMTYTVTANGQTSSNSISATKAAMHMLRAVDCLMTTDLIGQTPPAQTAVDVLSASSSFFKVDPKSVVLTGMVDVGQDYSHWQEALLQHDGKNDGKSLHVPEEGVWIVDDKGMVGFAADPKLTHPPTPVGYQFKDVMGNQSNMAAIVIDPKLTDALAAPATLGAMTDQAFWDAYQLHVSRKLSYSDADLFIALTGTLAGAIVTLAPVGGNPVSDDDFDKAYDAWSAHKPHKWDDPKGTAKPVGLFTVCKDLVGSATPLKATEYGNRYWRLTLMLRMAAQTLPPVPTN